jgi:drug/metabolite transporter (DMT)-like permease
VLKYLPAPLVSTVQLLDCVLAFGWGIVLFSEYPGLTAILGGVIVVTGVVLYTRLTAREEETSKT